MGVEPPTREEDLAALRALGVPYGQGFLLGRPQALEGAAVPGRTSTPAG